MVRKLIFILLVSPFLLQAKRLVKPENNGIQKVSIDLNFGSAYNVPTYLKIHQDGQEDIKLWARYSTKGFQSPVYWDYKLELQTLTRIYGIRSTHHKLHLENPTPEISTFSITHGYNLFMGYYGWKRKQFDFLVGAGIAFSHPEGIVNGKWIALKEGIPLYGGKYILTAPNFEVEAKKRWYLYRALYFNLSTRFVAGYARPKIIDGYFETFPINFHLTGGLGIDFFTKNWKKKSNVETTF